MSYRIELTEAAREDLKDIQDQRSQKAIATKIDDLKTEPEKRGKSLTDDLKGYYSVRAAGQRYRIVYRVKVTELKPTEKTESLRQVSKSNQKNSSPAMDRVVTVVVIGIRKEGSKQDAYAIARKRLD